MRTPGITQKVIALGGLSKRYGITLFSAWKSRKELEAPPMLQHELAFLPAHLELSESPVHPAPRRAMYAISGLAICVASIACFGRLDIVVSAKGKLVPNARVKIIQPAITGVVRQILVQDGQRVRAGEVLIELDPTQAEADTGKAHSARVSAALAATRASTLLSAQEDGVLPAVSTVAGATLQEHVDAQRLAVGIYREHVDKVASAKAELSRREADLQSTEHDIQRLRETAPLAREQANAYKALVSDQYVARQDYLDKEQSALGQEYDLAAKISHAAELEALIVEQRADIVAASSQFRHEQLDALEKANQELSQDRDDETKAITRQRLMTLLAPVSGTVQHLSMHTLGGVVPDDDLEVEANVENKDVGFITPGQEAVVKIDSFPYTRYGYLRGTVRLISNDASQDNRQKLTFMTRVKLPTNHMRVVDRDVRLTPGMAVSVEIRTGRRSVAGYFFDPLVQTTRESLRER